MNTRKINKKFNVTSEMTILFVVLLLILVFSVVTDNFFSAYNFLNILKQISVSGIIAIAMGIVLISGGIDLSLGESCGMSAMMFALFTSTAYNFQMGLFPALLLAIGCGMIIGVTNGLIISFTGIQPFIATIGTMTAFRGVIKLISASETISSLPDNLNALSTTSIGGLSILVWVYIICIVVMSIVLSSTVYGRNLYVLGSGKEVARLSGINVKKHIIATYTLSAFLGSIAGILLTIRLHSALPSGGSGYAMTAISAAVIGGVSFSGARGKVIGTVIGSFLLVIIENGGIHAGINQFVMEVISGALIVGAVVIDTYRIKKQGG